MTSKHSIHVELEEGEVTDDDDTDVSKESVKSANRGSPKWTLEDLKKNCIRIIPVREYSKELHYGRQPSNFDKPKEYSTPPKSRKPPVISPLRNIQQGPRPPLILPEKKHFLPNRGRAVSHLDHYSWWRRHELDNELHSNQLTPQCISGPLNRNTPSRAPSPKRNYAQPKFLQQPKPEPSYEDLLEQYRSIQSQLEDIKKQEKDTTLKENERTESKKSKHRKRRRSASMTVPNTGKKAKRKRSITPGVTRTSRSPLAEKHDKSLDRIPKSQQPQLKISDESAINIDQISKAIDDYLTRIRSTPVVSEQNSTVLETTSNDKLVAGSFAKAENGAKKIKEDSNEDDDDDDLLALRKAALESRSSSSKGKTTTEKGEILETEDAERAGVLTPIISDMPSDLLEKDPPIQEVQEKLQIRKGKKATWFDKELYQQMRKKDRALNKWKRHPCYDNWEFFKKIKQDYNRMLRKKKALYKVLHKDDFPEEKDPAAQSPKLGVSLEAIPLPNPEEGTLLQDNYETVEMEIDSDGELKSPALEIVTSTTQDTDDDLNEEELRAQLLQSIANRRKKDQEEEECKGLSQSCQEKSSISSESPQPQIPEKASRPKLKVKPRPKPQIAEKAAPVVINLGEDSTSDEGENDSAVEVPGLEKLIKEARQKSEKTTTSSNAHATPTAVSKLSKAQQLEYRHLKEEIARRENSTIHGSKAVCDIQESKKKAVEMKMLKSLENSIRLEKMALKNESSRMNTLRSQIGSKKTAVREAQSKYTKLQQQLKALEKLISVHLNWIGKANSQLQSLQLSVDQRKTRLLDLENKCVQKGKSVLGTNYKIPAAVPDVAMKKKVLTVNNIAQKTKVTQQSKVPPATEEKQTPAEVLAMKIRLQKIEQDLRLRLEELKQKSGNKAVEVPSSPLNSTDKSSSGEQQNGQVKIQNEGKPTSENEENKTESPSEESKECRRDEEVVNKASSYAKTLLKALNLQETVCLVPELFLEFNFPVNNVRGQNLPISLASSSVTECNLHDESRPSLTKYSSPLLHFRSYRLNPNFHRQENQCLDSVTFVHKIDAHSYLCRYDLLGTCNDDQCPWQHESKYKCSSEEVLMDLVLYRCEITGVSNGDEDCVREKKMENYIKKLKLDHPSSNTEDLCKLIVAEITSQVDKDEPSYCQFRRRGWYPQYSSKSLSKSEDGILTDKNTKKDLKHILQREFDPDMVETEGETELRYFDSSYTRVPALETAVSESPTSAELWLRLAYKHLYNPQNSPKECLEDALSVFSQALENNQANPDLWKHYLSWYAVHPESNDFEYLCKRALVYCPHRSVWWKCVCLVSDFHAKNLLCQQQLYHLTQNIPEDKVFASYCVLEVLLYWLHLNVISGRNSLIYYLFKTTFKSQVEFEFPKDEFDLHIDSEIKDILECARILLVADDLCLLWLCYLYFVEFKELPSHLFCSESDAAGMLCNKALFLIPWGEGLPVQSYDLLNSAFEEALSQIEGLENNCLLLSNILNLKVCAGRIGEALSFCSEIVHKNPTWTEGWLLLIGLHKKVNSVEDVRKVYEEAHTYSPHNPELIFHEITEGTHECTRITEEFVHTYFNLEHDSLQKCNSTRNLSEFPEVVVKDFEESVYTYLVYIEWQKSNQEPTENIVNLYEMLIGKVNLTDSLKIIWWQYITYLLNSSGICLGDSVRFRAILRRCISSIPVRQPYPYEASKIWFDYSFVNKLLIFLCQYLPNQQAKAEFLEEFLKELPSNVELLEKIVQLYLEMGDTDSVSAVLISYLHPSVNSVKLWQIALHLAFLEEQHNEVHRRYEIALQTFPYCATLWKQCILYEVSQRHLEHAKKLTAESEKYVCGSSMFLDSLLSEDTTGKDIAV